MPRLRCADDAAAAGPRRSTGSRATSACTPSWLRWTSAAWTVWPHGIGGPPSPTGVTPGGLDAMVPMTVTYPDALPFLIFGHGLEVRRRLVMAFNAPAWHANNMT